MVSEGYDTSEPVGMDGQADDYDSPWKEAIERYLPDFLAFYFPAAHALIDWTQPFTFLDQELRSVVRDAETGQRRVDKLVSVKRLDGRPDWIYIHLEVQADDEAGFAERMFVYHYRLYDRYRQSIASLALLADQRPNWQPDHFDYEALGCRLDFRYPVAKLLDWAGSEARLADSSNPFALLTRAHLAVRATKHDMAARKAAKWQLVQALYQRNFDSQKLLDIYGVLDWMLLLPQGLEQAFRTEMSIYEEEMRMRYVTSNERLAKAEGIEQGMLQGIQQGKLDGRIEGKVQLLLRLLNQRFGSLPEWAEEKIEMASERELEFWTDSVLSAKSIEEVLQSTKRN